MKILTHINRVRKITLLLTAFALVASLITSCKEEETMDQVVLQSFGPSGVQHGDTIKFIGLNLDKVSSIVLPSEVEVSDFLTKSANLIEVKVPKEAVAGKVILRTPQGDIESKSMLSFEVPVEITEITEEVRPGGALTIRGELVNWIESVTFSDGLLVEEFVSKSLNEVVVEVPMEAQSGFLVFATGGTEPLSFVSENELNVTLPSVTALNPEAVRHTGDLTLSGTDLDLVASVIFSGDQEVVAEDFTSHSATEIVLTVPAGSEKGVLTLTQASPVNVETPELTIVLPVGTEISPVPVAPGSGEATLTGTDLDLVKELILPSSGSVLAENFVSHSATEIVFSVPEGTENGAIGYTTIHDYSAATLGVNIIVPGEGPPPLPITIYDDELHFSGQDWSWGDSSTDIASTDAFYSGSVSFKHVQSGSDGGLKIGNISAVDASEMGVLSFALYGGPGTDGGSVAVILNDAWGNYNTVTLAEGKWTEYNLDLNLYPDVDLTNISSMIFKLEGTSGGEILYADRIGFDTGGPAALGTVVYDDAIAEIAGAGDGWGGSTTDFANTENVREGANAIKAVFAGGFGGAAQFGTWGKDPIALNGATHLVFSLYGGDGSGGNTLLVNMKDSNGEYQTQLEITAGEWTDVEIPLSDFGALVDVTEIYFQDNDWSGTVYIDYVGLR